MVGARTAKARTDWLSLPSGVGSYQRDPHDSRKGVVRCPDCGREQERSLPSEGAVQFQSVTGRCSVCAALNRSPLKGTLRHKSGATFLFDEPRDPERPNERAAIICASFAKGRGCLSREGRGYAYIYNKDRPDWNGLCHLCVEVVNHQWRKKRVDEPLNDGPDGGTWILYSKEDEEGNIPVRFRLCGCEVPFPRSSIKSRLHAHRTGKSPWPPCCRKCSDRPGETIERLLQSVGAPPSDSPAFQSFLEVVRAVAERWAVVREYPERTLEKRLRKVGLADIGPKLGINQHGQETDKNYRNRVSSQLKTRGVTEAFPALRAAVVEEIKAGRAVEEVARQMWAQRPDAKKSA
jgi:hypothetical protein